MAGYTRQPRVIDLNNSMLWLVMTFFILGVALLAALIVPSLNPATASETTPTPAIASDSADEILVWLAPGRRPGEYDEGEPGQLVWLDQEGNSRVALTIPDGAQRVQPCGEYPLSPDGHLYAFYVGGDGGDLYLMRDETRPVAVGSARALTCVGGGAFQYAPNSQRFGYIDYEVDAEKSEFADGLLTVRDVDELSEVFSAENVTAFNLVDSGAAYIQFFTNVNDQADEAAISWWDGSSSREIATLVPNETDCRFTSASVAALPDSNLLAVLGHKCQRGDTRTSWQIYSISTADRSATLVATDFQGGVFASFSRTNVIWLEAQGNQAYFTVPEGLTAFTVGLKAMGLTDYAIRDVSAGPLVMPSYNAKDNASVRRSPDGHWLAGIITSPDNDNALSIWNIADPSIPPITINAGSAGDVISSLEFTPDSQRAVVVIGGSQQANNSLLLIDLVSGGSTRVARGRFDTGLILSPDGSRAALLDWQQPDDPVQPLYLNLVTLDLNTNELQTRFVGADILSNGRVRNQRFAIPLLWR